MVFIETDKENVILSHTRKGDSAEFKPFEVQEGFLVPLVFEGSLIGILELSDISDYENLVHYYYLALLTTHFLTPMLVKLRKSFSKDVALS